MMRLRAALLSGISLGVMVEAVFWGTHGLAMMRPVLPKELPEDAIVFPTRDDLAL